jgi:hypothetical protein
MGIMQLKTKMVGAAKLSNKINAWKAKLPGALDRNLKRQALRLSTLVVKGIRSGAPGGKEFEPLAESTIMMKGSSKPLIDNGDLLGSIGIESLGKNDGYFVGVSRKAVDEDGNTIANIAEIMETGTDPYTIPVTKAMRGFMMGMAGKGKVSKSMAIGIMTKSVIEHPGIPARPFMTPSFEEWQKDAERQFMDGMRSALGVK